MKTIKRNKTWVRFAANGPKVKDGHEHKWRCCLGNTINEMTGEEIPLKDWQLSGLATRSNVILGTNPKGGTCMNGVVAWIDLYGDVVIKDDVLLITLLDPL